MRQAQGTTLDHSVLDFTLETPAPEAPVSRKTPRFQHALIGIGYLAIAFVVLERQWRDLGTGYLVKSGQDQTMWEWFFAVTAHSIAHLENPLGTTLQNYPLGVNLMANTAMFGVSVPLAPITLLFGPTVTYVLVLTLGLAGTAFGWYWVFAKEVVTSRFAAAVGGLFCGFAPGMVSHANGHPNFVVLVLLPLIALQVIKLSRGDNKLRGGAILGVLLAGQIGLGEEPLLIFAFAFAVFALVYYLHMPKAAVTAVRRVYKPVLLGGAIAVLITGAALWWQFFGAQSYRFLDHGQMGNDAKALVQFPSESLGGMFAPGQNVAINATEENAYFGWPLLILVAVIAVWFWRNRIARAATVTIVVFGVISLGAELKIGKSDTGIKMPWHWLGEYPLIESVLETRFALACIPAIGILLALATQRALTTPIRSVSTFWFVGLVVALLPLTPTPLPVTDRTPAPQFFANGDWREFSSGGSVVTVPLPAPERAQPLQWQADTDFEYSIVGGYFVGPAGSSQRNSAHENAEQKGKYGPIDRPTALLLAKVAKTGIVPPIDASTRATAQDDLHYWRADMMVLPGGRNEPALAATVEQLLGRPGTQVDDVKVWDVRGDVHG
ncbi:glycosyl transferase [Antrihabitans cavernicola]|uniref:Glycosyl transferase n=1 Tax=Antrihabitans cavernicola TaxID=2495913 RepID=A0A5A7SJ35_9NOCA|nr:glycosyl transferase [Spelaeibacter cavernicola]KAA0024633.1 glycosyl transferase [Spelaeibacter cavernicola]